MKSANSRGVIQRSGTRPGLVLILVLVGLFSFSCRKPAAHHRRRKSLRLRSHHHRRRPRRPSRSAPNPPASSEGKRRRSSGRRRMQPRSASTRASDRWERRAAGMSVPLRRSPTRQRPRVRAELQPTPSALPSASRLPRRPHRRYRAHRSRRSRNSSETTFNQSSSTTTGRGFARIRWDASRRTPGSCSRIPASDSPSAVTPTNAAARSTTSAWVTSGRTRSASSSWSRGFRKRESMPSVSVKKGPSAPPRPSGATSRIVERNSSRGSSGGRVRVQESP